MINNKILSVILSLSLLSHNSEGWITPTYKSKVNSIKIRPETLPALSSADLAVCIPCDISKLAVHHNHDNVEGQHAQTWVKGCIPPTSVTQNEPLQKTSVILDSFMKTLWRAPTTKTSVNRIRNDEYTAADRTWRFPKQKKIRKEEVEAVTEFAAAYTDEDRKWRFPSSPVLLHEEVPREEYEENEKLWREESQVLFKKDLKGEHPDSESEYTSEDRTWLFPVDRQIVHEELVQLEWPASYTASEKAWRSKPSTGQAVDDSHPKQQQQIPAMHGEELDWGRSPSGTFKIEDENLRVNFWA